MTLLKNSDGKILRNSGGKVLKQNFNFEGGLSNGILNIYLDLIALCPIIPDNWTLTWFANKSPAGTSNTVSVYATFGTSTAGERISTQDNPFVVTIPEDIHYGYVRVSSGTNVSRKNAYSSTLIIGKTPNAFLVGYGGNNSEDNAASGNYRMGPTVCGWVRIYNRALSDSELEYERNKDLGNEPLSKVAMVGDLKMSQAEILDFSVAQDASDMRVGVRNHATTTGAHAPLIGLPAGTNEEKRDYANQNLFTTF